MGNKSGKTFNATLEFVRELKNELEILLKVINLSDKKMSEILGQSSNYVRYLKKNSKRNPNFRISIQELYLFKQILKNNFGKSESKKILTCIRKYILAIEPRLGKDKIFFYHPKFKQNFFKSINSKEKSYWLGFIFSDGSINFHSTISKNGTRYLRFRFSLSPKYLDNIYIVKKFAATIGISKSAIKEYKGIYKNGRAYWRYGFEIINNKFCKHLINKGVLIGEDKTMGIRLPNLGNRDFDLAFLLGFFDGDGIQKTNTLTSGNRILLAQIKEKYNLESYNICYSPGKGEGWKLTLGSKLFNEMMDNYSESLIRKRRYFETKENRIERIHLLNKKYSNLQISQKFLEELQFLLFNSKIKDIALYYDTSVSCLRNIINKYYLTTRKKGWIKSSYYLAVLPHFFEEHFKLSLIKLSLL